MTRVVAIVGSREVEPWVFVRVEQLVVSLRDEPGCIVISGGATGVDSIAASVARLHGLAVEEFRPDYFRDGKVAPLVRNRIIAERCTELHAFPGPGSRGTWHVVGVARKLGRLVVVHKEHSPT